MAVLIPFTGGVESTYLLQKALEDGHEVIAAYYGLTQFHESRIVELTARRHILDYFKSKYPNEVVEVYGVFENMPHLPKIQTTQKNGVRQQWSLVNEIVATIASVNRNDEYISSVWLGWAGYDTAEYSLSYADFTENDYQRLCKLVPEILYLSNVDKSNHVPFMPLAKAQHKHQVYGLIDPSVQKFIVGNGILGKGDFEDRLYFHMDSGKAEEYKDIPINDSLPKVRFNVFEQALIDHFAGSQTYIDDQMHGYYKFWKNVPEQHRQLFNRMISNHILARCDKIFFSHDFSSIEEEITRYAENIKLMAGWEVERQAEDNLEGSASA